MNTITNASVTQPSKTIRSTSAASRAAFGALLFRDLTVLKKGLGIFIARTLVQPFLLVFVFLYVFPQIGQGIGGGGGHKWRIVICYRTGGRSRGSIHYVPGNPGSSLAVS